MPAKNVNKNNPSVKEENPSAFKHWISEALFGRIADSLKEVYPDFNRREFVKITPRLVPLELKDRVRLIRDQLYVLLPGDYPKSLEILLASMRLGKLKGFDLWPYSDFVQTHGLKDLRISLKALQEMTAVFSSEFAIRPFILQHPKKTMAFLTRASRHKDVNVRRWASEGSRPRLPWGAKLAPFVEDPSATLPILEALKFDEELYVRKSVSNHLNDIAKDHPDMVLKILQRWVGEAGEKHRTKIDWIIHRSLRNLIKAGHPKALKLVGANHAVQVQVAGLRLQKQKFKMNEKIEFSFHIKSTSRTAQKVVIDYIIHHVKSNKETAPKVFKLKNLILAPGQKLEIIKKHPLKPITTRKYYSGEHGLEIQVNGKIYAKTLWSLKV